MGSILAHESPSDACLIGAVPTGDPRDDASLVGNVLAGDHSAFGDLYDRYVHLIQAVCYDVTGDFDETDDLVHDVFLSALRRLKQLRQPNRFGAWLLVMARRKCRDWQRRRIRDRRQHAHADVAARCLANFPPPDDTLDTLRRAIAELPEKERLAIHLFYLEEQHEACARKLLGLSRSGFYRVLERARKRLRRTAVHDQEK